MTDTTTTSTVQSLSSTTLDALVARLARRETLSVLEAELFDAAQAEQANRTEFVVDNFLGHPASVDVTSAAQVSWMAWF